MLPLNMWKILYDEFIREVLLNIKAFGLRLKYKYKYKLLVMRL